MIPPHKITTKILNYTSEISRYLGALDTLAMSIPGPKLRKKNKISTIRATLAIEGHTFTEEQITAILENKKVIGPKKDILEVRNVIALYESISSFKAESVKDFLKANSILMKGIIESSGKFRSKNVGVLKGQVVKHVAPKPSMVPELIADLFEWVKKEKELHLLIKSCIVHYEIEFIHPFEDGNGRMGRFWQTVMLSKLNPIFKFIPVESLIEKNQQKYYDSLEKSDKSGDSTAFIEFMLSVILDSISEFASETKGVTVTTNDRLTKASEHFGNKPFSRKEYMELFKSVSSATASRDLKEGVTLKILKVEGEKNQTRYRF